MLIILCRNNEQFMHASGNENFAGGNLVYNNHSQRGWGKHTPVRSNIMQLSRNNGQQTSY